VIRAVKAALGCTQ